MEAHRMAAASVTELADNARSVVRFETDIVSIDRLLDREYLSDARVDRRLEITTEVRQFERARDIYHVTDDRARRREPPGSRPGEHNFTNRTTADEDSVVNTLDAG